MRFETVTFTSDFGLVDAFVGICHGVIAQIAPQVRVLDLTHGVAPQDVRHGAVVLADALPWLPPAVHLAVVDPGVGTRRRGLAAVTADGPLLVGPDNGLLQPAAARLGGITAAFALTRREHAPAVTFDGRDLFAPAAARLAAGVAPTELGEEVDPAGLAPLVLPEPEVVGASLHAEVLATDVFGNLQLAARADELAAAGIGDGDDVDVLAGGAAVPATACQTFADVATGALAVLPDAFGWLQVAVNAGSAAARLGVGSGARVSISRRGSGASPVCHADEP